MLAGRRLRAGERAHLAGTGKGLGTAPIAPALAAGTRLAGGLAGVTGRVPTILRGRLAPADGRDILRLHGCVASRRRPWTGTLT